MNTRKTSPKHAHGTMLYCFSPPVMLATMAIEWAGALYVLFRYRHTRTAQLIALILVCLGVFQLAEYMVCEGALGISSLGWARIGYVAISLLPPIGLHIMLTISQRRNLLLLAAAYGSGVVFGLFFLFVGHGMQSQECLGNYVIFQIAPYAVLPYTIYYYGWLAVTIALSWYYGRVLAAPARTALKGLILGYAAFIVPAIFVTQLSPATVSGIPSIMCGFAVILALTLLFWVAPRVLEPAAASK